MKGLIVVASLHKKNRVNGKYVNESIGVIRERCVVEQSYVDYVNGQDSFQEFYIVDEKATEERFTPKSEEPKGASEPTDADIKKAELKNARAEYKMLTGQEPKGNWGAVKIQTEIETIKENQNK